MTEKEHVQPVREAMVEIHGDVAREEYTGKYSRKCWKLDPLQIGTFAYPSAGQMELYLPEYFKMHKNVGSRCPVLLLLTVLTDCCQQMVFIGEHTSYT